MQVIAKNQYPSFKGVMNNAVLKKSLEMAADNGALFAAGTSLVLSSIVRPIAILATPKVEKENKQYACAKSIASSIVGFGIMAAVSKPIAKGVNNISENPEKYLDSKTINSYKQTEKILTNAKPFKFAAQIFKLSSSFITAFPKSFLTCALIPFVMSFFFKNKNNTQNNERTKKNISFGSNIIKASIYQKFSEKISQGIAKILKTQKMQQISQKYQNSDLPQHMFSLNDILLTGLSIHQISTSKKIKENRKKTLIYNAAIMTTLTITGGYAINKLLEKPTEIFIEKFKEANKNSPKLDKYIDGIKIAKPVLILGGLYYIALPIAATMLAEVFTKNKQKAIKS